MNNEENKQSEVIVIDSFGTKDLTNANTNVKQELRKYLEPSEINARLEVMPSGQNKMLLMFMWITGLRVSEIVKITKRDIDFKNGFIKIQWLKSRKMRERIVPFHSSIKQLLEFYTAPLNLEDRIFPITRIRAFQICTKYMCCSPHKLRHSFAVNWLRKGGDIVTLHKILGHSKIQTTMEYLNIVPVDQQKELSKITFI